MNEEGGAGSFGASYNEDDYEKDLDWLIHGDEETDTEEQHQNSEEQSNDSKLEITQLQNGENEHSNGENKNPSSDDLQSNTSSTALLDSSTDCEQNDVDDEEAKRYIAEKIEEANKLLEMETIDEKRERKLKFKENLVDLEVPPLEYIDTDRNGSYEEEDVVDGLSQLHFSDVPQKEDDHHVDIGSTEEHKDGKILVEKDGKFELVNLRDMESQHFLPPITNEKDSSKSPAKSPQSNLFGDLSSKDLHKQRAISSHEVFCPKPPSHPKVRPSSATHAIKSIHKVKSPRRVHSATLSSSNTTFSLSPEQKQLQKRIQEKQEKLRQEEEERRKVEEENKRKENEIAFKAWLHKKKDQLYEEKRIQQAKQLEKMNITDEERNPSEAYDMWLKRKHKEHLRERKMEELRKQESATYMREREECERAFTQWLRRKRMQKRAEHHAAKERSRRLLIEARRTKQMHNLLYNISDSKPFRYMDNYC
ncbi:coiled-coil domain-containing protein 181 [Pelodytes ibericus]